MAVAHELSEGELAVTLEGLTSLQELADLEVRRSAPRLRASGIGTRRRPRSRKVLSFGVDHRKPENSKAGARGLCPAAERDPEAGLCKRVKTL